MAAGMRRGALIALLALSVGLPVMSGPISSDQRTEAAVTISQLEGAGLWRRLGCVGCIALIVGTAVELSPFAIALSAGSNVIFTAGCGFACTIATL